MQKNSVARTTLRRLGLVVGAGTLLWPQYLPAQTARQFSAEAYPSIQEAIDRNPGCMIFVPPGDHVISKAIRLTSPRSGLWGSGRVIQANPEAAIIEIEGATGVQVRDLTLTRAEGKKETYKAGVSVFKSANTVLANLQILDNWGDDASLVVQTCQAVQIRDCLIENYSRISIDDRTEVPGNGYAFTVINGTGIIVRETPGTQIQNNRIIERRMVPTKELKERLGLGTIVKKTQKGEFISQENWDNGYVNNWHQGSALQVTGPETSEYVQITGNYIENAAQGIDIHADHVVVAQNIVNNAFMGIKALHGARNVSIIGNQFTKCDLWGININVGWHAHVALPATAAVPARGTRVLESASQHFPVRYADANLDGYTIVANNIISDFGYGNTYWMWKDWNRAGGAGGAPLRFSGGPRGESPPLGDVLVQGNLVYDPGRDQIMVDGQPRVEPPRYKYTVRVQTGASAPPTRLHFVDNILPAGSQGVSNVELKP
jgi:hypothetical protein